MDKDKKESMSIDEFLANMDGYVGNPKDYRPYYNPEGDCMHYTRELDGDDAPYCHWVDDYLELMISRKTGEVVGVNLFGIKRAISESSSSGKF